MMGTQERKLDETTTSMNMVELNNLVVSFRPLVQQAKVHVISKLSTQIKKLRNKKGTDAQKEANSKKADRFADEIHALKKVEVPQIAKFCLSNTMSLEEVMRQNKNAETKVLTRIATHKIISNKVHSWRTEHDDWKSLSAFLLSKNTGRRIKKKKSKDKDPSANVKDSNKDVKENMDKKKRKTMENSPAGKVKVEKVAKEEDDSAMSECETKMETVTNKQDISVDGSDSESEDDNDGSEEEESENEDDNEGSEEEENESDNEGSEEESESDEEEIQKSVDDAKNIEDISESDYETAVENVVTGDDDDSAVEEEEDNEEVSDDVLGRLSAALSKQAKALDDGDYSDDEDDDDVEGSEYSDNDIGQDDDNSSDNGEEMLIPHKQIVTKTSKMDNKKTNVKESKKNSGISEKDIKASTIENKKSKSKKGDKNPVKVVGDVSPHKSNKKSVKTDAKPKDVNLKAINKEMVVTKLNLQSLSADSEDIVFQNPSAESKNSLDFLFAKDDAEDRKDEIKPKKKKRDAFFMKGSGDEDDDEDDDDEDNEADFHDPDEEDRGWRPKLGVDSVFVEKIGQKPEWRDYGTGWGKGGANRDREGRGQTRGRGGFDRGRGRGGFDRGRGRGGFDRGRGRGGFERGRGRGDRGGRGGQRGRGDARRGGGDRFSGKAEQFSKKPVAAAAEEHLHPSWEASRKRKQQASQIQSFAGKKTKFDDDSD